MTEGTHRSTAPLPLLRWRDQVVLWLGTFLLFATVAHGSFETTDAAFTMHAARALWVRADSGLLRAEQGGDLLGERLGAAWIAENERIGQRRDGKIGRNGRAYVWYPMGHVWLLVPFVAVGDALEQRFPGVDAAFRARVAPGLLDPAGLAEVPSYVEGHPVVTQGLIAFVVPPAVGATMLLLLLGIARQLGAGRRDAAAAALAILLATQCFALGRETLSDGPGLACLLGAMLAVVQVHQGRGSLATSFAGGLAAGAAVLLRYQSAFLVLVLGVALALACRRQQRWRDLGAFVAGGLPALGALLAVDAARFGDPFDTGYPEASDWFDQPVWVGATKLLFGAGRGVMWLSPLLWLALPSCGSRRHTPRLRWLAWALFLIPLLFFAAARGWQGGQNWAARYVTPGVVALLAIALPQAQPWRRWPRLWPALVAAGLLVNVTSVVAPVRGVLQLGAQAVRADAARAVAAGTSTPAAAAAIDPADVTGWHPRYTPLLANWRYAFASRRGGFEDEHGQPVHGSAHTIEALFGIAAVEPAQGHAPMRWEDRCGRHLWWRFWGDLLAVPGLLLLLPVVAGAVVLSWCGWRRALRGSAAGVDFLDSG